MDNRDDSVRIIHPQVYSFLDKMSFYIELYKHKPPDVISHEDGTLWRRQAPKLLYPLGEEMGGPGLPAVRTLSANYDLRHYLPTSLQTKNLEMVWKPFQFISLQRKQSL